MQFDRLIKPVLVIEASGYYCNNNGFTLEAGVSGATGNITFVLWTSNSVSTSYGPVLMIGGQATYILTPNQLTNGTTYYIQAVYSGDSNHGAASTPPGTAGTPLHPTNTLTTAAAVTPTDGQYTFCSLASKEFTVTVIGTESSANPTSGSITLKAVEEDETFTIGTGSLSGSNSVVITSSAFTENQVFAVYAGDGTCFGGSTSSNITVDPTVNYPSLSIISQPTLFCYTDGTSFTVHISSSAVGTIVGNLTLNTGLQSNVFTQSISGSSTGFNVTLNVPGYSFTQTGPQITQVVFSPTGSNSSCYGTNSVDGSMITVVSNATQTPSLSMLAPNVISGPTPPNQSSTIQFTAALNTTGMAGTINDGSQYITFYAYSDSNPYPGSLITFATAPVTSVAGGTAYYYGSFNPTNTSELGGAGQNFYFFCDFGPGNSCFNGPVGSSCGSGSGSYYECGTGGNTDTVQITINETPH